MLGPDWMTAQSSTSRLGYQLEVAFCTTFLELAGVGIVRLEDFDLHETGVKGKIIETL